MLQSDARGGAIELGRLEHCAAPIPLQDQPLERPAVARASAPAWSSEEFTGKEAIYLAVLVGCEVKKVGRLSSFLEGWSEGEKGEGEEEKDGTDSDTAFQQEDELEKKVAGVASEISTEEMSSTEEDLEEQVEGEDALDSSSEMSSNGEEEEDLEEQVESEDASDASSESMCGGKSQYSLQIRLWPESARLVLVLFGKC